MINSNLSPSVPEQPADIRGLADPHLKEQPPAVAKMIWRPFRDPAIKATPAATHEKSQAYDDALSALTNLGYKKAAAEKALSTIEWTASVQLETAIKDALKELVPQ